MPNTWHTSGEAPRDGLTLFSNFTTGNSELSGHVTLPCMHGAKGLGVKDLAKGRVSGAKGQPRNGLIATVPAARSAGAGAKGLPTTPSRCQRPAGGPLLATGTAKPNPSSGKPKSEDKGKPDGPTTSVWKPKVRRLRQSRSDEARTSVRQGPARHVRQGPARQEGPEELALMVVIRYHQTSVAKC